MNDPNYSQLRKNFTPPSDADRRREAESTDEARRKIESNTQRALDAAGFGRFNYKTVLVSGLICVNVTLSLTSLGFVMPSAACDFNMDTVAKGRISTSLISGKFFFAVWICVGMLFGFLLWSWIADSHGRKKALLQCLLLQGCSECAASLISNYWGFVFFKFFSGLADSGQMTIVYTYVGEFQPTKYREKVLCNMQMALQFGVTLSPIIAWFVIPLDVVSTVSFISFKSWNLFVLTGAVFPILIALSLLPLPETPKYLADTGRYDDLYKVLDAMYRENSGHSSDEYLAKLDEAGISLLIAPANKTIDDGIVDELPAANTFRKFFKSLYGQTGGLFRQPYIGRTLNICVSTYLCFAALYSLMFWFPEIFHRFADFEKQHPGEKSNICVVSTFSAVIKEAGINRTSANSSVTMVLADNPQFEKYLRNTSSTCDTSYLKYLLRDMRACNSNIETEVYTNTLMMSLAGFPATILFILSAPRIGIKFSLVCNSFICCAGTIGLIFVTSSRQHLIISCVYSSLMTISIAVLHCVTVELYPTNLRVSASALSAICGRIGAFVGNMSFGYLIDYHCYVLVSIVAAELFLGGGLAIILTNGDEDKTKRRKRTIVNAECTER